jgi:hypothetical protein
VSTAKTGFELVGEIAKVDRSQRRAFGWVALAPDGENVVVDDASIESIPIGELEQAAYPFLKNQPKGEGRLIESFVLTREKARALGLSKSVPVGWWVGIEYRPGEAWEAIASGLARTFRIHGKGLRHKNVEKSQEAIKSKEVTRMTTSGAVSAIKSRAAQLEAEGLEPAEAFSKAMDENPSALQTYRESRDSEPAEEENPFERQARVHAERMAKLRRSPARRQLLHAVEQIKKLQPSLSESEAWAEAHRADPALYAAAKKEEAAS